MHVSTALGAIRRASSSESLRKRCQGSRLAELCNARTTSRDRGEHRRPTAEPEHCRSPVSFEANIEELLKAAKKSDYLVFVSPHDYYPTDHGWKFGGTVETMMHDINMFDRSGALSLEGFEGSGADWLE